MRRVQNSGAGAGASRQGLCRAAVLVGCGWAGLWLPAGVSTAVAAEGPAAIAFNRDIRPILSDNCFFCHGPDAGTREADLRLDTAEGLFGGQPGEGPVVAGDLPASELIRRIRSGAADEVMPPPDSHKQLSAEQIALLERWVREGATYEGHWAFEPVAGADDAQPSTTASIDQAILLRLTEHGLAAAPLSDRITLLRRLHVDLTGLPPTPAEAEAFLSDASPDAYQRLVDRLLASPHYGERMAMWWLDLVRYADTVGYHGDQPMSVSPFRDYVIAAFNGNMPFDQFTIEQLAGDLLPEPTQEQQIAAGYNRLGMMSAEGGVQPKEYLAKYIAERVRNVSGAWLGITLGCAECHDHKFYPFTTRDFYRFEAFFADIKERGLYAGGDWGPTMRLATPEQEARLAELDASIASLKEQAEPPQDELDTITKQRAELEKAIPSTLVTETVEPRMVRVLARGNWMDESGEEVVPGVPESLAPAITTDARLSRLDLARWIVDRDNPLTARVLVNRLWALLFGEGLSRRLDDVGGQGEWPSHPELLDRLAADFMRQGWDVKRLLKAIVMSEAYQRSSVAEAEALAADPGNRWLGRQGRFRLDAELVRDNALAVSGLLVRRIGGESVFPYQPVGYWAYLNFPTRQWQHGRGDDLYRRGLYTHWQRQYLHPSLLAFDAPSREECTAKRARSNTPLQSLALLNDPSYVEAARVFAQELLARGGGSARERIDHAFMRAVTRPATDDEAAVLEELLTLHREAYRSDPEAAAALLSVGEAAVPESLEASELAAWTNVARTILNLHEVVTRN